MSTISGGAAVPDGPGSATGGAAAMTRARPLWWIAGILPFLTAFLVTARVRLNGDVDYALGTMETAGRGGVGVGEVFAARPYAYRLFMDVLDRGRRLISDAPGSTLTDDVIIRCETVAFVVLVGVVLYAGLRRRLPGAPAGVISLVVTGSLAIAPPWHFLEPDWVGVLFAVLGVGTCLLPRNVWLGAVAGGIPLLITVAMKTATFPWALIALIAIGVLSRRRAIYTAIAWLLLVVAWLIVTRYVQHWEWRWLQDQAKLVHTSPIHNGIRLEDLKLLLQAAANVVIVSPILVAYPVAAAVLVQRRTGRARWVTLAVLVVVAGLCLASGYGQGEFFMYHFAGMPVVGAAVWAVAVARPSAARLPLVVAPVLGAIASAVLMAQPLAWRRDHLWWAIGIELLIAAAATGWALIAMRRRVPSTDRPWWVPAIGVAAAAALVTPLLPRSTYSFDLFDDSVVVGPNIASIRAADRQYDALRARIGADTRVTYFTYGAYNRALGNPTTCRYPSPQWLQRSVRLSSVRNYPSYIDNLRCLTSDGGAKYLVWEPSWFSLKGAAPQIREYAAKFDCSKSGRVPAPRALVVCPRKPLP
ncbi:hypothetical protein HJ588_02395 [Flexivirga sp. ID2601S]|uniref:Glycosyltransferase RgtA/B/C/D-like domain-containing protein n=1 Tax=Flexivirga aerilata TaxID=1656889 RepID=A0A849AMT0_9MICO|nr:hypothetical protein [Flexivirga aerilata]NNG38122.1 hypothetical protein [Flexivirga aerilata]